MSHCQFTCTFASLLALTVSLAAPSVVRAQPVLWPGNGHYYEVIRPVGGISWTAANAAANQRTHLEMPGHLVTLNSDAEWQFVRTTFPFDFVWIGLSDAQTEGTFQWVTGEPLNFTAWLVNEPNNAASGPGEDYAWYENRFGSQWGWNDYRDVPQTSGSNISISYAIEFQAIPEPSSAALAVIALTAAFAKFGRRGSGALRQTGPVWYRLLMIVVAFVAVAPAASAQVILSDDFNDNSLDAAKWTTALPFGNSSVVEQNQRIELSNRGYLITQGQFNPAGVGGLRVRGQYTFLDATTGGFDFFQVVTRTAAVPSASAGEVSNGLSFTIRGDDQLRIHARPSGLNLATPVSLLIADGDTVDFAAYDNGFNLLLVVTNLRTGTMASIAATSSFSTATNRVAFYNREFVGAAKVGYLDNVTLDVAAVPEPSSMALVGLATGGIVVRRLAKRMRRGNRVSLIG